MAETILTPQILIVGAGPVGVPLAIGLKRQGYDVLLVEKVAKPIHHFKGEYLQPSANQLMRRLELNQLFTQRSSSQISELRFRDLDASGRVRSDLLMQYPEKTFALSISHGDLLNALWEHAKSELGERFLAGVSLRPENQNDPSFFSAPVFTAKHSNLGAIRIAPQWVIGCDGRFSVVRSWMDGARAPRNAPVTWFSGEEFITGAEIRQPAPVKSRYEVVRTHEAGTISVFSLGEAGQRLYYGADTMKGQLNVDRRSEMNRILNQCRPFLGIEDVDQNVPIAAFPAYTANFNCSSRERFILAGDACGVTTPYGGQGITGGLEQVRHLLEDFDFSKPNEFDRRRYGVKVENVLSRISLLNFGLYYLFFARAPVFKLTSSYVINLWEANPELKERVVRLFGGLDTDQPQIRELLHLWGLSPKLATSPLLPQSLAYVIGGR